MREKDMIRHALAAGRQQAGRVVAFRRAQIKKRVAAVARATTTRVAVMSGAIPPRILRAAGPQSTQGVLVAEGDSWFDYPWHDVLSLLEDDHGFDIESVAHKGDRVENMAYADGQLVKFTRRLEKLVRRGVIPRAILLSGGGNDMAGAEFGTLLDHAASPVPGINGLVAQGVIDQRIRFAYITIIARLTAVCDEVLGQRIPVLIHGYDYAVPDGRGFLGGFSFLPGPWLEPGLRDKGFANRNANTALLEDLMDRFNRMLGGLASLTGFAHVRYLDLRGTLPNRGDYKKYWANELHPTEKGFRLVADKFATVIGALP